MLGALAKLCIGKRSQESDEDEVPVDSTLLTAPILSVHIPRGTLPISLQGTVELRHDENAGHSDMEGSILPPPPGELKFANIF
ncbi:hypothetical protein M8J75_004999 [Diaphorina citri]|nr:hypothetical protein M8J75_004999 [Diaphorina citri]